MTTLITTPFGAAGGVERELALVEIAQPELPRLDAVKHPGQPLEVGEIGGRTDVEVLGEALNPMRHHGESPDHHILDSGLV